MLFRGLVGLEMDDPVWDVTVLTKNRNRLLEGEIAEAFFGAVLDQARAAGLLSDKHFTVDGTIIEAWAGQLNSTEVEAGIRKEKIDPIRSRGSSLI